MVWSLVKSCGSDIQMAIYGKKLTNSKILINLVKWSCFLVDLTISDPLTNGQMVTIQLPCLLVGVLYIRGVENGAIISI